MPYYGKAFIIRLSVGISLIFITLRFDARTTTDDTNLVEKKRFRDSNHLVVGMDVSACFV